METFAYLHLALVHEEPVDVSFSAEWDHFRLFQEISWGKLSGKAWVYFLSIAISLAVWGMASQVLAQVLREGSTGPAVTAVQQRLQELGYFNSRIDGSFGPTTEAAVIRFQRSKGLSPDGEVGSNTTAALFGRSQPQLTQPYYPLPLIPPDDRYPDYPDSSYETLQRGDSGPLVKILQRQLKEKGFDPGLIDGKYGSITQSAVRDFERSRGLYADGIADSRTLAVLDVRVTKKNRYVVVVPGNYETRIKVMECVGAASLEKDARRGFYVNAGAFSNYHTAQSLSEKLRSCDLDARVVRR